MVNGRSSTSRHRLLRLVTAVGIVGAVALAPVAANAAESADGQWWYEAYGVDQVHADGVTGEGVKIAVLDAQINPDLPVFADADLTVAEGAGCAGAEPATDQLNDGSRHGSTVTALLIGNGAGAGAIRGIVPDASVTFYGYGEGGDCAAPPEADAAGLSSTGWLLSRALADGADIITTSRGGGDAEFNDMLVVADAIAQNVPIVAAVSNDPFADPGTLPQGYSGVVAVNAVDAAQQLLVLEDWDIPNAVLETTVVAPGSPFSSIGAPDGTWDDSNRTEGSSLATPLVAGILAAAAQKYPDATGNQLVQSLIRNTGPEDHELRYSAEDGFGYGIASLGHVLRTDPTQYEDVNPLLDKLLQQPDAEQIAEASAAVTPVSPEPTASDVTSGDTEVDAAGGFPAALLIGGIVALIVVIAAAILTVVLVRRSHRTHREGQS